MKGTARSHEQSTSHAAHFMHVMHLMEFLPGHIAPLREDMGVLDLAPLVTCPFSILYTPFHLDGRLSRGRVVPVLHVPLG